MWSLIHTFTLFIYAWSGRHMIAIVWSYLLLSDSQLFRVNYLRLVDTLDLVHKCNFMAVSDF